MKKITRLLGMGVLSVAALSSFTSCEKTGFKVGLLCLHGQTSTYDNNFINAFKAAAEEVKKEKGLDRLDYEIKTDVAEDYNRIYTAAKEWAEDGYSLVCADSFGHQNGLKYLAGPKENSEELQYPNTEFCHATGTLAPVLKYSNFHNAFADIYKGRFLTGCVAGFKIAELMKNDWSHDAIMGYVGAYPYAEVISGYTSFYLGAKYALKHLAETNTAINPDKLKMKVRYTSSWYDYKAENEAALALIDSDKCILISQHADSMGAPTACKSRGVPNICYNIDTNESCPDTFLVASRINWKPYYKNAISQVYDRYKEQKTVTIGHDFCGALLGTLDKPYEEDIQTGKIIESSVDLCRDSDGNVVWGKNVSEDAKDFVKQTWDDLSEDKIHVFDVSTFTVTEIIDPKGKNDRNVKRDDNNNPIEYYTPRGESKHLETYKCDYIDNGDYKVDGNVILQDTVGTYVAESYYPTSAAAPFRSAPYFDLLIDGIDLA